MARVAAIGAVVWGPGGVGVQDAGAQQSETAAPAPIATAVQVEVAPVLDGEILMDPAWSRAAPANGFTQIMPDEGQPGSEQTEVRIVYTADTLYVGVLLRPEAI